MDHQASERPRVHLPAPSLALSGVLLAQLVFMAGWMVVSGHPSATFTTWLAAIAALAMGMQSSAVGSLEVKSVFTTAVTATLINLSRQAADPSVSGTEPARLAGILVCLVVGATFGGLLLVHALTYVPLVPPVATALAVAGSVADRRALQGGTPVSGLVSISGDHPRPAAEPERA